MTDLAGYDLEERLGDGGMGTVYKARQQSSGGRLVALKRVRVPGDPVLLARIKREAEILASLDHPHIVGIYEFVPDGLGIAIAMQYAAGGSLADRLAIEKRLDAASVVAFAAPIARALASAHHRGVLHRDIKPGNILFTSDGEPLLSDFGIARWSRSGGLATQEGVQLGTAGYLDPSVAGGSTPDERSDVYSLGLVCYEALTGTQAFTGPTPLSVLRATDRGVFTPLAEAAPDCPATLAAVVERAMSRKRGDRFSCAAEFALALRDALPSEPTSAPPPATAARQLVRRSASPPTAESTPEPTPTQMFGPRPPAPEEPDLSPTRVPTGIVWAAAVALFVLPTLAVLLLVQH